MATLRRAAATAAALALALTACGGAEDAGSDDPSVSASSAEAVVVGDGPTVTVGSFNFAESQILGNIYALALEDAGYPVETQLDLGSREVIFSELESGAISFLPEYVGSALSVGFGGEPSGDLTTTLADLTDQFAGIGVTVLEPAPGQDQNVFVVTQAYADEHSLVNIEDLAGIDGTVTVAGAPECETRPTCLLGLTDTYGLGNITFESIQEGSVRVSSLEQGAVQVGLLFSTQPVIAAKNFVALTDTMGIVPVENIVPVVSNAVIEAYGSDFTDLVNRISAKITTALLIELNGKVELDAEDADDVARAWLVAEGFLA